MKIGNIIWDVPNSTDTERKRYTFIVKKIVKEHQKYFPFEIGDGLKDVFIFGRENRSQELKDYDALGIAFFTGDIHMEYLKIPRYDAQIIAMEYAHNLMSEVLSDKTFRDESNNLVHYAANVKGDYLRHETAKYYDTRWDFVMRRGEAIEVMWYNFPKMVGDMIKINAEIESGTAPTGSNPYWAPRDIEEFAKKGIVAGSVCVHIHEH